MIRKIKIIRWAVITLSTLFAIFLVAFLIGRGQTTPVIVVSDDRLEENKPLLEQTKYLQEKRVSTKELEQLGGQFVTDYSQLKGKKLRTEIKTGSPIPLYLLTSSKSAGQFASETPENHALFTIPEGLKMLPPGIEEGDRISVKVIFSDVENDKEKHIAEVVPSARVASISKEDILLFVSDQEFNDLALMKEFGQFVLTLPGIKKVGACDDVTTKLKSERDKAITKLKASKSYKAMKKSEKTDAVQNLRDSYELRIINAECSNENDKGGPLYSEDLKERLIQQETSSDVSTEDSAS